jgi:hypothetical protein
MASVFYRSARTDGGVGYGPVVRRVYRDISELEAMLQAVVRSTSRSDYSAAELQEMIAEKRRILADKQDPSGDGNTANKLDAAITRAKYYLVRWQGKAADVLTMGLASAYADWSSAYADDKENAELEYKIERVRSAWQAIQDDLRNEWLAQKKTERLTKLFADGAPINVELQANAMLQQMTAEEKRAEARWMKDQLAQALALAQSAAAGNALVAAELDRMKAENEALRAQIAQRRETAASTNTVTNLKADINNFTPATPEQAAHHAANKGEASALQETGKWLMKNAANPSVKKAAGAVTTALVAAYVTPKLYAQKKYATAQELDRLKAQDDDYVAKGEATAAERQRKGQELVDRLTAIRGLVKRANWDTVFGRVESWGLMTNRHGDTYSDLDGLVTTLEKVAATKTKKTWQ